MDAHRLPTSEEARASLDEVVASRQAAVEVARRPVWLDVSYAVAAGIALGVATTGGWPAIAAGMGLLCAVIVVYAVMGRRLERRRGQILDERAIGARAAKFFPMYFIVFAAAMFHPGEDWQPWYSIGVGTIVALAGVVYLRLEDRYQARRLTAGDYDRYDLM